MANTTPTFLQDTLAHLCRRCIGVASSSCRWSHKQFSFKIKCWDFNIIDLRLLNVVLRRTKLDVWLHGMKFLPQWWSLTLLYLYSRGVQDLVSPANPTWLISNGLTDWVWSSPKKKTKQGKKKDWVRVTFLVTCPVPKYIKYKELYLFIILLYYWFHFTNLGFKKKEILPCNLSPLLRLRIHFSTLD